MFDMFGIFGKKKSQDQAAVVPADEALEDEFVMVERRGSASKGQEAVAYPITTVYPSLRKEDHQGTAAQGSQSGALSLSSGIDGVPFVLNSSLSCTAQRTDLSLLLQRIETVQRTLSLNYDFALERSIAMETRAH
uniref:UMA domain-containing protein n=1 Tax=Ornithodoros turicata TaxID=34597 RepID=A0A2R5LGQ3_9ACAR